GFVNDFAGALSASAKAELESELSRFTASTTNEIAVVTISALGGDYIENYAVHLFEEWGIGSAENDNANLVLLSIRDQELPNEVGYGLEGAVPDSLAQTIIDGEMVPLLKETGDYHGAIAAGVRSLILATKGEYVAPATAEPWDTWFTVAIFGLVAVEWLAAMFARSKSIWAGGVVGGVAGVALASVFGLWVATGVITTLALAALGTLFDFAVSTAYHEAKARGHRPPWWTGGAGNFGGGGGGSGGFGGFGGGSSGGGGASGNW
ncbi:MAG: TPM domain-containing protein, partial [Patescibacteria group bacterium]